MPSRFGTQPTGLEPVSSTPASGTGSGAFGEEAVALGVGVAAFVAQRPFGSQMPDAQSAPMRQVGASSLDEHEDREPATTMNVAKK